MQTSEPLNPRQIEAVHHDQGPLLVLAGPGSGKTRVLTSRIAHLVREKQVDPHSILAITFTNKAAEEMRLRVQRLLGPVSQGMWIGTFHATCARILRRHIERLGFEPNFVIYDDADQVRVIKGCLKARGISEKTVRPAAIKSLLERASNQAVDPRELELRDAGDPELLRQLVTDYASSMKQANALDFGDMIVFVLHLLQRHPDLLRFYQSRFPFILVDEYQDTNRAQHALLKALVPPGGALCVVGDDDQAIYRWRGAEVENMLLFEKDFPGSRVVTLEQNYRSTGNILNAAQAVARGNPQRLEKQLWTANPSGGPLIYFEGDTQDREADFVAGEIGSLVGSGTASYGDVGVFYRTNAQSRSLEERFLVAGIPYRVVGSLRFYERAEVKDLMAYLRVLYNPRDSVSLLRILNRPPRGIGAVTQERMESHAAETGQSVWEAMEHGLKAGVWAAGACKKIDLFRKTILALSETLEKGSGPADLLRQVVRATRYDAFLDAMPDGDRRRENVDELIHTAADYDASSSSGLEGVERLGSFCERISLVTGADTADGRVDGVSLMTLHCAKGLEFTVVFLTGMENGLMPHQRSTLSEEGLSEERRLCYVGMTRAREKLYLSRARTRHVYGERRPSTPSPFLRFIPPDLIRPAWEGEEDSLPVFSELSGSPGTEFGTGMDADSPSLPSLAPPVEPGRPAGFRVGDLLMHESLGEGTVYKVERAESGEKIIVRFFNGKIRKLMAHTAPIKKLSS